MVKRPVTPPPAADEPRVLAVTHPYPPNPNLERDQDLLCIVFWLACIMGDGCFDHLYTICHKPTSADILLIEVRRDFPGYRRLLGAHKWSEFVRNPGHLEDDVSKIYFSTLPNGRAVEKAGWKRIFIEDEWFDQFNVRNRYINYPYPLTSYCFPPAEDMTTGSLCRPIPFSLFGLRRSSPPPIPVGSSRWVKKKEALTVDRPPISYTATDTAAATPSWSGAAFLQYTSQSSGPIDWSLDPTGLPDISSLITGALSGLSRPASPVNRPDHPDSDSDDPDTNYVPRFDMVSPTNNTQLSADDWGTGTIITPARKEPEKPLCPTHGIICKKAICQDYRRLLKNIERELAQAARGRGGFGGFNGNRSGSNGHGYGGGGSGPASPKGRGRGALGGRGARGVSVSRW